MYLSPEDVLTTTLSFTSERMMLRRNPPSWKHEILYSSWNSFNIDAGFIFSELRVLQLHVEVNILRFKITSTARLISVHSCYIIRDILQQALMRIVPVCAITYHFCMISFFILRELLMGSNGLF